MVIPGNNIVYLIGFMGSGKTTTGRKLSKLLGWSFTDLDARIVEQAGMTIPEIFSTKGEAGFREIETEVLTNFTTWSNCIISTGGGTPCHGDNMEYMLDSGLTIYLKLTPAQLRSRLSQSSTERPLIKGLKGDALLNFIEEKLACREEWYNRAEIVTGGFETDVDLLYHKIKERFGI